MKLKIFSFMLIILLILCACGKVAQNDKDGKAYMISEFSKIKIGMTYEDVVNLIGEPTYSLGSGMGWDLYEVADGWYFKLSFAGNGGTLIDIRIVDEINNREFVLEH